jgi:zinc transporter ZupT
MSGVVEPLAALVGAAAVILMEPVLPYALSFAAGAMIYVVFDVSSFEFNYVSTDYS